MAELKNQPQNASDLKRELEIVDALQSVEVKPATGSVVLQYQPAAQASVEKSLRTIFPSLPDLNAVPTRSKDRNQGKAPHDYSSDIARFFRQANREVESATGGIDLSLLIPLLLLALSMLAVATSAMKKGKFPTPSWYELLWFAFNTFVILDLTLRQQNNVDQQPKPQDSEPAR